MPHDYYDYVKKQIKNENYTEISELVRQNLWNETIDFKLSQSWISTEDKLFIILYMTLRYA